MLFGLGDTARRQDWRHANVSSILSIAFVLTYAILNFYLASSNIFDPRFSWWGDEGAHYDFAKNMALKRELIAYYLPGVYTENPALLGYYPAFFMWLTQPDIFNWKAAYLLLLIPGSVFCFYLGKNIHGNLVGIGTAMIFCSSFYVHNFFSIGYPNPLTSLLMLLLIRIHIYFIDEIEKINLGSVALLGALYGFAAYFYLGQVIPIAIAPFFFVTLFCCYRKFKSKALLIFIVSYLLVIAPGIFNNALFNSSILGRVYDPMQGVDIWIGLRNSLLAMLGFLVNTHSSHYIFGASVDTISALLIMTGLVLLLKHRSLVHILLLLSYFTASLVLGFSSNVWGIPHTRFVMLLPILAIIGGYSFAAISGAISNNFKVVVIGTLAALLLIANYEKKEAFAYQVGFSDIACVFQLFHVERTKNPQINTIRIISDQKFPENFLKFTLAEYQYRNVKILQIPRQQDFATSSNEVVIDLNSVYEHRCRSRAPDKTIFPLNIIDMPSWLTN